MKSSKRIDKRLIRSVRPKLLCLIISTVFQNNKFLILKLNYFKSKQIKNLKMC